MKKIYFIIGYQKQFENSITETDSDTLNNLSFAIESANSAAIFINYCFDNREEYDRLASSDEPDCIIEENDNYMGNSEITKRINLSRENRFTAIIKRKNKNIFQDARPSMDTVMEHLFKFIGDEKITGVDVYNLTNEKKEVIEFINNLRRYEPLKNINVHLH